MQGFSSYLNKKVFSFVLKYVLCTLKVGKHIHLEHSVQSEIFRFPALNSINFLYTFFL